MKKKCLHILFAFVVPFVMFSITGCKTDAPIIPESVRNEAGSLSFKVNGFKKETSFTIANITTDPQNLQISAGIAPAYTEGLSISFSNPKVGSFDINQLNFLAIYIENAADEKKTFIGTKGKGTITFINEHIVKGTFEFSGTNVDSTETRVITDGRFVCKLTKLTDTTATAAIKPIRNFK